MESWKTDEIRLLRTDIEERLVQMGIDATEAASLAQSYLLYNVSDSNGIHASEKDLEYLNARFRRIQILCNIDFSA